MTEKKPYAIDVAVLLIFFSRPGCFGQVFEQVKAARPSRLFLYQDGPRRIKTDRDGEGDGELNQKDVEGIARCREIAEDIDWDCRVERFYQEKNVGCDPSEYIAQKWAFSMVDKCIILEDDDVPSQSFFPFCRELLDRYEDDERINMICGMNNLENVDSPYSYLFSTTGSIWGWATWRRVTDKWEGDYAFLDSEYDMKKLSDLFCMRGVKPRERIDVWKCNRASGVEHYETILGAGQCLSNSLNIVPTQNMIRNVGNTPEGGTHSTSGNETIPHGLRRIFTMKRYEIDFPLKHPKYVIEDLDFQKKLYRLMGVGHPFVTGWRRVEKAFLLLRHEGFGSMIKKIKSFFIGGR